MAVDTTAPSTYTAPLTGQVFENAAYVPEPTAEQVEASKDTRIAELEAQVAAQNKMGRNRLIATPEGERSIDDILAESQAYRVAQAADAIRAEQAHAARQEQLKYTHYRPDGSVAYAPEQVSRVALQPTMDAVEKAFGLGAHNWTPQQKAKATTNTQHMVDSADVTQYFGKTSIESKATALHKENPALYKLLKERALRERKF